MPVKVFASHLSQKCTTKVTKHNLVSLQSHEHMGNPPARNSCHRSTKSMLSGTQMVLAKSTCEEGKLRVNSEICNACTNASLKSLNVPSMYAKRQVQAHKAYFPATYNRNPNVYIQGINTNGNPPCNKCSTPSSLHLNERTYRSFKRSLDPPAPPLMKTLLVLPVLPKSTKS